MGFVKFFVVPVFKKSWDVVTYVMLPWLSP